MEKIIRNFNGNKALEIGIGSGYLTKILCSNYLFVIGMDIDFDSVMYAKEYTLLYYKNKMLICSDIHHCIKTKFDLILSNPPYLPNDPYNLTDNTIYGGKTGIELTIKILEIGINMLNRNGKIVLMRSSLSDQYRIDKFIHQNNLSMNVIAKKKFFFETLEILEISKKEKSDII